MSSAQPSSAFWKTRRVVVTGGAGFLGRPLVEKLKSLGAGDVTVPRSREFDLRHPDEAERLMKEARPNVVLHCAGASGGIGANRAEPGRFFYDNAAMGLHTMEAARRHGVLKYVQVGTVCSYPKLTPVPFKESELWNGYPEETNAPYGLAKKMLLAQGQAYRDQYKFNAVHLLMVNLYGPGDNFDLKTSHTIPALIRKCLAAKKEGRDEIEAWGTGKASREFLYVDDAADAILLAAERYDGREPVNVGSGQEISIRELAEMIVRLTGFRGKIAWNPSYPDGQPRRGLDVSRAEKEFGFKAPTKLEDGIRETLAWYERAGAAV